MNLQIFTHVKTYTDRFPVVLVLLTFCSLAEAWQIDLSRRREQLVRQEASVPTDKMEDTSLLQKVFASAPSQEIVILNTEKGFVPSVVRVPSGSKYVVHIVNVNKSQQNVSFVMDYFGEHHGSFYGQMKSFTLDVKKEGIFSYQCPETAFEGRFVVFADKMNNQPMVPGLDQNKQAADSLRDLASEKK